MGMLARSAWPLGWTPNADAVGAPPGSLLRADNLILDERDILSLRRGSTKINASPIAESVDSLHTQSLAGTRYRMWGAGNRVYSNGAQLPILMDGGTNDISFGTHMGQIFFARGLSKYKYDGTTVRNWGIQMTGGAPTVVPSGGGPTNSTIMISGDSGESPAIVFEEGSGVFANDRTGVANAALEITVDPGTGRAVITKTYASDQDFTSVGTGPVAATDDSILSFWFYVTDPTQWFQVSLQISVNGPTIWSDAYSTIWFIADMAAEGKIVSGWNKLTVRRGDMVRGGPGTPGQDWSTVRMIRVVFQGAVLDPGTVRFDELMMAGGEGSLLNGTYEFAYVYVRDDGSYIIQSDHSAYSEKTLFDSAAALVTVPADASRDSQINQIWVFRRGENLPYFYRTAVYSGAIGAGAIAITDSTSDADALVIGIIMQEGNAIPPNGIIGIEGPYYERLFVLTATHLYPSRRLNPDMFSTFQVIRVAGPDEIALWVKKAFNGLYIGTTKDVYRLDGTGAEYPDGTMEFTLTPLNIDNPPRNEAVAQEGNLLVYMAADGWRAFTGAGTQQITGDTSLLYQGQDRHGVSAISTSNRFRAAIAKGQLVAITPEGASTVKSQVLYRYTFSKPRWYRHTYTPQWKSVFREPDGSLVAGDDNGTVWVLDSERSDDGTNIPVVLWTVRDGDGNDYAPKQAVGFMANIDSGEDDFTIGVYSNDDAVLMNTVASSTATMAAAAFNISTSTIWRQVQLRLTGSFNVFRFSSFAIPYLALPMGVKAWDSGPMDLGQQDLVWARRVTMKVRASADLTVTPYFDGVAYDAVTIDIISTHVDRVVIIDVPVGRGYFGYVPRLLIESANDFYPFWVEFQVRRTEAESEKPNIRIPSGLGGEATA